ncbi:hypothetical protein [Peribacillus sp. NPDC097225]|uniref:hypothetical protein n=1 Tax=Peribacillus sp. NPDC097225 TaxID=3364400 RepID=UPI00381F17B8
MKYKLDDVATSFEDIYERLPRQLNELINAPKYKMKNLTEGTIKKVFGEDSLQ